MKLFSFASTCTSRNILRKRNSKNAGNSNPRSRSDPSSSSSDASTTPRSVLPDGKYTRGELQNVLLRLGSAEDEVVAILAEVDRDGDGVIDIEALLRSAPPVEIKEEGGEAVVEELRAAFGVYDANGDGKISAEELLEVLRLIGDTASTVEDCRRMIGGVDSDGDGMVCFRDFARMMSSGGAR